MLERHFSEAHADAEKNISVQDEGKKLFDKGVIIKNGQKRRDKNVIKTLKCFKLVPNAKNKMINGHKFHSGKSSVVKTYLKRGRKKLKSAPEIDLFDWFSNKIEKDDKEAGNGLPSSTRSETAVNQVEKEVEDEFVMENHRQVKNAKTSTADNDNDPSGQKISEEKTKLAYDDQSGFDDSDSGFPDEHARFSFTEEEEEVAVAPGLEGRMVFDVLASSSHLVHHSQWARI